MRSFLAGLPLLLACAAAPPPTPPDAVDDTAKQPPLPAAVCGAGSRWSPGTTAFVERTAEWGLDAIAPGGSRLSSVDFDNDGWPDLTVRRVGVNPDNVPAGSRYAFVLRNTGAKSFEDATASSGILQKRVPEGDVGRPGEVWAFGDVDNDGDLDLYTGLNTEPPAAGKEDRRRGETSELLLNDGGGHFVLAPAESALRRASGTDNPGGASWVDVDLDGRLDLWAPQNNTSAGVFLQSRLYKGDGTGSFTDATVTAGLTTKGWSDAATISAGQAHARAWGAAACDLNNDGRAELLTPSYGRAPNHLFQAVANADGTTAYVNRSVASGYAFDENQNWTDNQFARCWCLSNPANASCAGVPPPLISCGQQNWDPATDMLPFRLGGNSGSTVCRDIDNDGDIDLVTSEIRHWWAGDNSDVAEVLLNTGAADATFERPGRTSMGIEVPRLDGSWDEGIMTAAVFDFDNDGWPDIYWGMSDYPGNHGLLLHQRAKLQFETVGIDEGIDHHRSHGVVTADFDRDGDLDVLVGHSRSRCDANAPDNCYATDRVRLFENVMPSGNWVQLTLEGGDGTNRAAIGARVTVISKDGLEQTQEVGGGFGHFGQQNDLTLHFGLGAACEADVLIRWPNAARRAQAFHVTAGHRFHVKEGAWPEASVK